jgi:4-amino-4-deoxy-L-arabinose transferase-like glycosyltransferase
MTKVWIKKHWLIIVILTIGFLIRFYQLAEIPPGMSHDELEYVNNGYSIYQTGRDLYGDFLPLSIGGVGYVAIPAYIAGLPTMFFGLSEWSVRLLPVIFGTAGILLVYGITKILFKSKEIALFAALVLSFSVWGIKISRVMFDPPTALFFYLLGIYLFLKSKDIKLLTLALIVLVIGWLSYYGSLFIFPFVVLVLTICRWDFLKKIKKQFLISAIVVFGIAVLILLSMMSSRGHNSRSLDRSQELILFNTEKIVDNVIYDRSYSTSPEFLNRIFINKGTYLLKSFSSNYLGAFSPRMIFVDGDLNILNGLWGRGELSILDFPLILIGIFLIFTKYRREGLLIVSLILIAPITSGLTAEVYSTRAFLLWPFLIILAGVGLSKIWEYRNSKSRWIKFSVFLFLALYIFIFLSGLHQYFFRYPTYAKEAWFDSEKQLANYLITHKEEQITIYSLEGRQVFMEYLFFSKLDPKVAQKALTKDNIKADIVVGNFRFVNGCLDPEQDSINHKVIVQRRCTPLNLKLAKEVIKARDKSDMIKWAIFVP